MALLIAYLPTIYAAFSAREKMVTTSIVSIAHVVILILLAGLGLLGGSGELLH